MLSEKILMETWQFWSGIAAFFVIAAIGIWLSKKKQDLLASAIVRFKFLTIAYGMLIFALMLALPPLGGWMFGDDFKLESLEQTTSYQKGLGLALYRLREIVQWALQFLILWLIALYAFLKVLVTERSKSSD